MSTIKLFLLFNFRGRHVYKGKGVGWRVREGDDIMATMWSSRGGGPRRCWLSIRGNIPVQVTRNHCLIPSMIGAGQRCSRFGWGEWTTVWGTVKRQMLSCPFLIILLLIFEYCIQGYRYCAVMLLFALISILFCCWAVVRIYTLFIKWCEYGIWVMN